MTSLSFSIKLDIAGRGGGNNMSDMIDYMVRSKHFAVFYATIIIYFIKPCDDA